MLLPFASFNTRADEGVEIIIHFRRSDGKYDGWNIWSWADGRDGAAFQFTDEDDFGKIATFRVPEADTLVGFIVRTDSWDKDVDYDQFIDLEIGNEIWVVSERFGFTYDKDEAYSDDFFNYEPPDFLADKFYMVEGFEEMYTYHGELGAIYTKEQTIFRLWSPTAEFAYVNLYPTGHDSDMTERLEMVRIENGAWEAIKQGDLANIYYTFSVFVDGWEREAVDPYARAAGVNGRRGMVVDLEATNPTGWFDYKVPGFTNPVDAVIYELHVRDFSINETSGMVNRGKYLAFTETGTTNPDGLSTGVDHLVELGVTHIHLLPVFDFRSINERELERGDFNWGYDPENYNLPEGSYSTDPFDGNVRINEFKQMVQSLHQNGLLVVMDVVYNHTGATADSNLNLLVPDYYYRHNPTTGRFSNGSGCGNETASERAMVRRLIIDSVVYWATEYRINGFRFDLMGLHDIETMNLVREALDEIDPTIIIYGEGWTGGGTPLPREQQALKDNAPMLHERIAVFSDDMRDGIKGHVFNASQPGFVNGDSRKRVDVMFGVVASVRHPQIDYASMSYSKAPWAIAPTQTVNYASAHDNLTLWDKLVVTNPSASDDELLAMNRMAALLVLTSQGIPFIHAGEEIARTKDGDENSYKSPDSVNMIRWEDKKERTPLFEYYKGLIALRANHPAFRLRTAAEINDAITFINTEIHVLAYTLDGTIVDDEKFLVAVNTDDKPYTLELPEGKWTVVTDGKRAGYTHLYEVSENTITLEPQSGYVLVNSAFDGPRERWSISSAPSWLLAVMALGATLVVGGLVATPILLRNRKTRE
jgi:pullulanase